MTKLADVCTTNQQRIPAPTTPSSGRALRVAIGVVLSVLTLWSPAGAAPGQARTGQWPIQGMTLSTPRGSSEWAGDAIVPTMHDLGSLGVNWIAIHPYARIARDGTVSWRGADPTGAPPTWLRRPIEEAHRLGLKIMIKPHLAYWGSFAWRGEIRFESAAQWDRFFSTYRVWIEDMARWSHDADAFVVGTELDATLAYESEWRDVIARVRRLYAGPLTYAANWTDYDKVPFWDAVDAIGVQAYFPVLDRRTPPMPVPPQASFDDGWARIMARMREFSAAHGKVVVFTELGYNRSELAPYEPWNFQVGGVNAEALQEACMRAALRAIADEPAVVGGFLWKWFPGDARPRDFEMSSDAMRQVIAEHWRSPARD